MAAYSPMPPPCSVVSTVDTSVPSADSGRNQPGPVPPPVPGQIVYLPVYQPPGHATSTTGTNVVVTPAPPETGPRPNTAWGLVLSILVTSLCPWPCGIGAIVTNYKARSYVTMGQYAKARSSLSYMTCWIIFSFLFGVVAWIIFGIGSKATTDAQNEADNNSITTTSRHLAAEEKVF